jgi:rhodanese-related sulfurtransferase
MIANIDRIALQAKLNSSRRPILAEALPEKYFRDAHLPGAIHLSHDAVDALAPQRLPDRGADIVVYCANRNCRNSHIAAQRLSQLGYTSVSVYADGKQDWMEAGLPLEREAALVE